MPTHTDRYLDFKSCHPISEKRAVVGALMDRAENVCSDPVILAKEMVHLNKVLCYNNYPQWMIDKCGRSEHYGPLIHPETGNEIKKQFFYLSSLFSRFEWVLQEDLQIHTHTDLFQGGKHPQVLADAFQRQGLHWTKEGCCLPLGVPGRWV